MKKLFAALLALMALGSGAFAQILVEVTLDQEQFLPGEALTAAVRITNRSGQKLQLGGEADWLSFSVESREGLIVSKNGEAPVLGEFTLDTAQVGTKRVDLAPYFALTRPGRYRIIATLRVKAWGAQMASPPKDVDIISGSKFWTQDFGVPGSAGPNQPPETRRYSLLQVTSLHSEIRVYVRVSDSAEARLMRVFPLGSMVSFGRPETQVDSRSQLHVLQQNDARAALYSVVGPEGELVKRQFYDFGETRPRLQADREGNITVVGGTRRVTPDDLPGEKPATKPSKR